MWLVRIDVKKTFGLYFSFKYMTEKAFPPSSHKLWVLASLIYVNKSEKLNRQSGCPNIANFKTLSKIRREIRE